MSRVSPHRAHHVPEVSPAASDTDDCRCNSAMTLPMPMNWQRAPRDARDDYRSWLDDCASAARSCGRRQKAPSRSLWRSPASNRALEIAVGRRRALGDKVTFGAQRWVGFWWDSRTSPQGTQRTRLLRKRPSSGCIVSDELSPDPRAHLGSHGPI